MKKTFQTLLAIVYSLQLFAQNSSALVCQTVTPPAYADIDVNHRTYVNQVFGLLEQNRVSTGLLVDYGFDFRTGYGFIRADDILDYFDFYIFFFMFLFSAHQTP